MKKLKFTKEKIVITFIAIISGILNFANIGLEGTGNAYYAAAVKSMTMSLKNFFFVSFDPSGFVTIDKPPLGYWLQAISAKIFGYHGWSIMLPQAISGVISVVIIYIIVKRAFGAAAGLLSALCLAVTPVFVAVSRNNTVDNVLVLALLLACWALSIAAEKGKLKYLILSMVLVGIGFNIKMLQAYMVVPALYITYLLTTAVSFKKRIVHLAAGTAVLLAVTLSWALIVDAVPASSRPYIDSSTNNTVMELITGHNGIERISLSSKQGAEGGAPGGNMQAPPQNGGGFDTSSSATQQQGNNSNSTQNPPQGQDSQGFLGNRPDGNGQMGPGPGGNVQGQRDGMGGPMGGGTSGLQGSFGGEVKSSITRLFSKNILSDQIVWFIPLAVFGFIAAAIRERMNFKLDNKRKQALTLWFMWFLPVFIYFSFNTGTFHSYYLTMLAPPTAALAGIGIGAMWEFYKKGGWKSWLLPASLALNGAVQVLMLYYFISSSNIIKILMILVILLCFGSTAILALTNMRAKKTTDSFKLNKTALSIALAGLLITPFAGSAAALSHSVGSSFPAAGLELLSANQSGFMQMKGSIPGSSNSGMIDFLLKNKTAAQKYLLVVSSANDAADIIVNTGEPVMAMGGFLGSDKSITLNQFIELVNKGEVRYVMSGGMRGGNGGGNSVSEIMNWVQQKGKAIDSSEYSSSSSDQNQNFDGFGGRDSGQLYDLKPYTDSLSTK